MEFKNMLEEWKADAACFRRWGYVEGAALIERCAVDVTIAACKWEDELLTPSQASAECGVSTSQLARLARNGQLANRASSGRPRYRRADLPRRASLTRKGVDLTANASDRSGEVLRDILASNRTRN